MQEPRHMEPGHVYIYYALEDVSSIFAPSLQTGNRPAVRRLQSLSLVYVLLYLFLPVLPADGHQNWYIRLVIRHKRSDMFVHLRVKTTYGWIGCLL